MSFQIIPALHRKSWGSFYAFVLHLCLRFESVHVCTDRNVNTNANAWITQMATMRHSITTASNRFDAVVMECLHCGNATAMQTQRHKRQ